MLEGRFGDTSGAPYIEARISFPRLKLRGLVSLLMDTGADGTVIMPTDSRKLGIDFATLRNPRTPQGIGGPAHAFEELAILSFSDRRYIYSFQIPVHVLVPTPHNHHLTSILGRDILKSGNFVMDMMKKKATLTPRTWSLRQKV